MSEKAPNSVALPATPMSLQPRPALPGARKALALLIIINMFNYIDRYNLAAVEGKIRANFFADNDPHAKFWMGSLATAFMVSYMLLAPLFGWLGDRTSRWRLIAIGVALWSVATGFSGLAWTFIFLFAARCFVGVGEAAYGPAAPTVIADMYPVERRGTVMAWFYAAIPIGSALGYAQGALIASALSWHWAFFVVVPPGIVLAIICLFMTDPPRGHSEAAHAKSPEGGAVTADVAGLAAQPTTHVRKSTVEDYKTILRTPSYLLDTLGMTAMSFAVGGVAFWMPTYVFEVGYGYLPGQADIDQTAKDAFLEANLIFSAITVVAGLLSTLLGGWAGDKLRIRFSGSYFLVSGAAMMLGFFFFLGVLWIPFPIAWIMVFLSVFCLFFNTGPTNTILANVIHPSMRATAIALNIFLIHAFGDAVSPAIIGEVAGHSDLKTGFLVVSAMILVSGAMWLWGARYLERDTELAPKRLDV